MDRVDIIKCAVSCLRIAEITGVYVDTIIEELIGHAWDEEVAAQVLDATFDDEVLDHEEY